MTAYRLSGDVFSPYFFDRVLFEDAKFAAAFRIDTDLVYDAQRLVRTARKTLSLRSSAQSTESQLLRPLAALAGWTLAAQTETVDTLAGSENAGFAFSAPDGTVWARAFCTAPGDDIDASPHGRHRRFSLAGTMQRVLETTATPYALAVSRNELRIVRRPEGGTAAAIAFKLDALAERGVESDHAWRLLLGLTAPAALSQPLLLERIVERGREAMVGVGEHLGRQVMEALDLLARSLYAHEANRARLPQSGDERALAVLYAELLRVLYRLLFALFAEARGLVPVDLPLYRDNYALSTALAAPRSGMADRIRALFVLLRRGADIGGGEKIPAFGGALFAEDAVPLIESLAWDDDALVAVLTKLTRIETPRGHVPVSYRELDEERLGSIYERLLELRLSVADRPMERIRVGARELVVDPSSLHELSGYQYATREPLADAQSAGEPAPDLGLDEPQAIDAEEAEDDVADNDGVDGDAGLEDEAPSVSSVTANGAAATRRAASTRQRVVIRLGEISPGTPYLASSSGRKETASYYTARDLVDFLVRETVDPQAERAEPAAILRLRVVDPAMGSGHFLIGAMRRLGDHLLAAYRRSEEADGFDALPPLVQAAWEDDRELLALCRQFVAVHCLYGVDKNPLAVDLARVALWLATAAADHPLSFLDHRLRCGDSLLGLDVPHIIVVEGAAKPKRRGNANGQYAMLAVGGELVDQIGLEHSVGSRLVQAFAVLRGFLKIVDDEREPFKLKRQQAEAVRSVLRPLTTLHAARVGRLLHGGDEGRGAFLAALGTFATLGYLGERDEAALAPFVRLGEDERAFCWPLEFPDAYYSALPDGSVARREDAGFDVVLGNPPWDKVLLDKRGFYSRFDPLISDFQGTSVDRRITSINSKRYDASLAFNAAIKQLNSYAAALNDHGMYEHQVVSVGGKRTGGHPDTYKYFLERGVRLSSTIGRVGLVIPGAFTSGDGSTGLRRMVLQETAIQSLFVFENRKKLFPIDSRFKFLTIVMAKPGPTNSFEAAFWIHDIGMLQATRSQRTRSTLTVRVSDIEALSPERFAILEVRSILDFDIVRRLRASNINVGSYVGEHNARIGQELNMTTDRQLFFPKTALLADGAQRSGDVYVGRGGERYVPLREGRMVQAYDGNAKRYVSGEGRSAVWTENGWPKEPIEPHYWVREDALNPAWTRGGAKLYWCDVTGATNERTAMAVLVPANSASGHSLAAMYFPQTSASQRTVVVTVFNSFVFDWYVRLSVAQHMSFNFVEPAPFVRSIPHPNLARLVDAVSSPETPYAERANLRAELDAAVALAYELSYAEFAHILESFALLDRAEPPLDGEVRSTITRDLALAAYCRLAAEHDPEHGDRIRAARALGALGYVASPLRAQLPNARQRRAGVPEPV